MQLTEARAMALWSVIGASHYNRFRHWYEPSAEAKPISLLTCDHCFRAFSAEYSVSRAISGTNKSKESEKEKNRQTKFKAIREFFRKNSSNLGEIGSLDQLALDLKCDELTRSAPLSWVSKVAAFVHPDKISPYDRFARMGAEIMIPNEKPLSDLASYQDICGELLSDKNTKQAICAAYNRLDCNFKPDRCEVFGRRVLDLHLMQLGKDAKNNFCGEVPPNHPYRRWPAS